MSGLVLFLGLPFSIFAALTAFLIDYEEQRQHYQGWREPLKAALATSLIAFLVFGAITVVMAFALPAAVK